MLGYIVRRLVLTIPILLGVSAVTFLIIKITPGDAAELMLGISPVVDPVAYYSLRESLGLDQPVTTQYLIFLQRLLHADLGRSFYTGKPVVVEVSEALPKTLALALASMAFALAIGIVLGIIAAKRQSTKIDSAIMTMSLLAASVPNFWLGLMFILLFSFYLNLTPVAGAGTIQNIILPALTLGTFVAGSIARMTRASMVEVLRQDYIRAARARGLADRVVIYGHALRNAMIPVVTVGGLYFGNLMAGSFFVEKIFAYPGIGRLAVDAISRRDFTVIQGVVLTTAVIFVLVNLLVDILYAYFNPRIQYE